MSYCHLNWSTNFLIVIKTNLLSQNYLKPQPCLLPQPRLLLLIPYTLNFSHWKELAVPRTYLMESMLSWGSFIHSFNSIHWSPHLAQALCHAPSHHHQVCLSPPSVHSSSLNLLACLRVSLRNILWTTQPERGAPLLYFLYMRVYGGQQGRRGDMSYFSH